MFKAPNKIIHRMNIEINNKKHKEKLKLINIGGAGYHKSSTNLKVNKIINE